MRRVCQFRHAPDLQRTDEHRHPTRQSVQTFFSPPQIALQARSKAMISPFLILIVLALLFAVCSIAWSNFPLLPVSVILVCVALLIGKA